MKNRNDTQPKLVRKNPNYKVVETRRHVPVELLWECPNYKMVTISVHFLRVARKCWKRYDQDVVGNVEPFQCAPGSFTGLAVSS